MIIIAITILGFLNSIGLDGSIGNTDSKNSVLTKIGIIITPVFKPMGIKKENWPASVALLTGLFAKESVIGTLNSLYTQMDSKEKEIESEILKFNFLNNIKEAFLSIKYNLSDLFFNSKNDNTDEKFAILLKKYFSTNWVNAYAYLLFVLIYFPCVAALGAIIREIGVLMGILNVTYLTVLGWITATLFYQVFAGHQLLWIIFPILLFTTIIGFLYILSKINKREITE
jgi:ferrous iron transport protein B